MSIEPSGRVVLVADIGFAAPIWLDFSRILTEDLGWQVTIVTPSMNRWQRKFFDVKKAGSAQISETKDFPMFYRRNQGMPRLPRILWTLLMNSINQIRSLFIIIQPKIDN